jgi:MFS family permease
LNKRNTIWNRNFTTIFIVNIFTALSFHILTPTLPKYTLSLGFSSDIAGFVVTMFTITAIIIRVFAGRILDNRKKRGILIISLILISAAILGYSKSTTVAALIVFRLLHGIGWGLTTTANSTIAAEALPEDKLGRGIGIFGIASSLASAVAPNLGLQIVEAFGFFAMFLISFGLAVTGSLISILIVEKDVPLEDKKPALPLYSNRKLSDIGFSFFSKSAIFPAALMALINISYSSISTFIAVYAENKGIYGIGYYFTVSAVFLLISRPLFGRISDNLKKETIFYPCAVLFALVFAVIYFAKSLSWLLIAAALFGIGYGGLQPTIQVWCVKAAGEGNTGKANSTYYTAVDIGQGIGSTLAGVLAVHLGYGYMYLCMIVPIIMILVMFTFYVSKTEKIA